MYSRRFHEESLQIMQDEPIRRQNLCHRQVMPCILFLALCIPGISNKEGGRIWVSHFDLGSLILRGRSERRELYHRA